MYKLYWDKGTGAFAPQAALHEAGAEVERIRIDLEAGAHHEADFLAVNPRGQVPVLVLPDGTLLTESAAMLLHIADAHPGASLLPPPGDPDRAKAYRWLIFGAVNVYETTLRVHYADRYSAAPDGGAGVRQQAEVDLDGYWAMVAEALGAGPYLLGEPFCVTDIYYPMLAQWHPDTGALLAAHPGIARWCDTVCARPAIAAVWAEHFT